MYKEPERQKYWVFDATPMPAKAQRTVLSPLHYGETAELILTRGIEGEVTVNGRKFILEPQTALFVPPKQLHSSIFRKGGGQEGDMIRAFHINLKKLQSIIDLKSLFAIDTIPTRQENFEELYATVCGILEEEAPFSTRICRLIRLFELLSRPQPENTTPPLYNHHAIRIAEWVEEHYLQRITVQEAADAFGYSKYYFCKWVRTNAGTTFSELLNAIRINHAATHLLNGCSIEETAARCGFSDPSYFIKVFKKITGITPKTYQNLNLKKYLDR